MSVHREQELTDAVTDARRVMRVTELVQAAGLVAGVLCGLAVLGSLVFGSAVLFGAAGLCAALFWLAFTATYQRIATVRWDEITGEKLYLSRIEVDRRRYRAAARELNDYWISRANQL